MKNIFDVINEFNEDNWVFERDSGYSGYRIKRLVTGYMKARNLS